MFKNRALQVKMVKTPKNDTLVDEPVTPKLYEDSEQMKTLAQDIVRYVAIGFVAVITVSTVLHTASEIVIKSVANGSPK